MKNESEIGKISGSGENIEKAKAKGEKAAWRNEKWSAYRRGGEIESEEAAMTKSDEGISASSGIENSVESDNAEENQENLAAKKPAKEKEISSKQKK
jgi:hypothetical protein